METSAAKPHTHSSCTSADQSERCNRGAEANKSIAEAAKPSDSPHGDGGHVSEAHAGDELGRRLLTVDVAVHPSGARVDNLDGAE